MGLRLSCLSVLLCGLFAAACEPSNTDQDAGVAPVDTGQTLDAGTPPADSGAAVDSGVASDAGAPPVDAGADAGAQPDAATPPVDAGPSGCEGPNPQGCSEDADCPGAQVCNLEPCAPSSCFCQDGQWACTADCAGGVCEEPGGGGACEGNNPAGCMDDADCGAGFLCDRTVCAPSSCNCNGGVWACTRDCRGGRCIAAESMCGDTVAPSGCFQFGCPPNQQCVREPNECSASSCQCSNGTWMCTRDCRGGGTCMP